MRVVVDRDVCEGHGQCEFAAPDVFTVSDDGTLVYEEHPPEAQRSNVLRATRRCPVQAITLEE